MFKYLPESNFPITHHYTCWVPVCGFLNTQKSNDNVHVINHETKGDSVLFSMKFISVEWQIDCSDSEM